jgi:hypothetical protein
LVNPFLGLGEAFLGRADRFKVFTELLAVALGKSTFQVASFLQHMIEDALSATDLAQNLGLVRRALFGKEPSEGIADTFLRRHHAANASESKRVCWPSEAATYWSSERRFLSADGTPVKMRACAA